MSSRPTDTPVTAADHQGAAPAGHRRMTARIATALAAASITLLLILGYALEAYVRPVLPAGRSAVPGAGLGGGGAGRRAPHGHLVGGGPRPRPREETSPRDRHRPRRRRGPDGRAERRRRIAHGSILANAHHHRGAGDRDQPVLPAARQRLPGGGVHQRPAEGVLLQGRGDGALQPPLLLDPPRGGGVPLPPLQPPRLGVAPGPRRLQG